MRAIFIVAIGGALGASGRWAIGELIERDPGAFPWATLLVNVTGCALVGLAARHLISGSERWLAAVTGFLGGLTTFSTFANETRDLIDADRPGLALVYVATSVVIGLAATEVARGDWRRP